ncbi:hypothetical protein KEM55_000908, partial [Ascosphaera atra]
VLIPGHITEAQRKIITKKDASEILERSPILVNLGNGVEEEYPLKPLNSAGTPKTKDARKIIKLMKTKEDWDNLLPFLRSLADSRKIHSYDWEWIVRKAGEKGYHNLIVKCALQARHTGISLGYERVARYFYLQFHREAQQAGFKGEQLEHALKVAQKTALLFNLPEHAPPKGHHSPQRLPDIIGVFLELSAAVSISAHGSKDFDNNCVLDYAQKVVDTWPLGEFKVPEEWPVANEKLQSYLPLWNGIRLALNVDSVKASSQLTTDLTMCKRELEGIIDESIQKVKDRHDPNQSPRIGILMASELNYDF